MPEENKKPETCERIRERAIAAILKQFPSAKAIVDFSHPDSRKNGYKYGDLDALVIVPEFKESEITDIQKRLRTAIEDVKSFVDLDPSVIAPSRIAKGMLITSHHAREAHGVDRYRMKYMSEIVYGDKAAMDAMPAISLEDALSDVIPHVRDIFIPWLKKHIQTSGPSETEHCLIEEADKFFVISRIICSGDKHAIASKPAALDHLRESYPRFAGMANVLKAAYMGTEMPQHALSKELVLEFLDFSEKKMTEL
jgi:hypothetical protein